MLALIIVPPALGQPAGTAIVPGRALGPIILGMPAAAARAARARFERKTGCPIDVLVTDGVVIAAGSPRGGCLELRLPSATQPTVMSAGPVILAIPMGIGGPATALVHAFGTPLVVGQGTDEAALIFPNGLAAHVGTMHTQGGIVTYLAVQAPGLTSVPQIGHFAADAGKHVIPRYSDGGSGDGFGPPPTNP